MSAARRGSAPAGRGLAAAKQIVERVRDAVAKKASRGGARKTTAGGKKKATKRTAAQKSSSKRSTARKKTSAKKTATKSSKSKRSTAAKKTGAKKPPRKTATKKTAKKKTAKKKTAKKKTAAKKAPAARAGATKKTAAPRKAAAKRAAPRKADVRKGTVKSAASGAVTPPRRSRRRPAKLDAAALKQIEQKLRDERAEYERQLRLLEEESRAASEADTGEAGLNEDFADAGSATFDRQRDLSIRNNVLDLIDQVTRALDRIEQGTYGTCERCGNPIDAQRIKAFPRALLCLDCKRREERIR